VHWDIDKVENDHDDDDETGYCKAPKKHRFQKGAPSPNPNGRPKRDKVMARLGASLHGALNQTVTVNEGDKVLKMTRKELMVRQLVKTALTGEKHALVKLLKLREKVEIEASESPQQLSIDAGDMAICGPDWKELAKQHRAQQRAWEAQQRKQGPSFRDLIDAELAKKITATVRGKPKRMATLEAICIQFANVAAKGDDTVIDMLLRLAKAPEATVKRPFILIDPDLSLD
jgi:hypothetical protein